METAHSQVATQTTGSQQAVGNYGDLAQVQGSSSHLQEGLLASDAALGFVSWLMSESTNAAGARSSNLSPAGKPFGHNR